VWKLLFEFKKSSQFNLFQHALPIYTIYYVIFRERKKKADFCPKRYKRNRFFFTFWLPGYDKIIKRFVVFEKYIEIEHKHDYLSKFQFLFKVFLEHRALLILLIITNNFIEFRKLKSTKKTVFLVSLFFF